ncbi:MAG: TrkH family potassium uptake protein [Candidatus Comchoanobacterales bacterium]
MRFNAIFYLLGYVYLFFGLTLLVPLIYAWVLGDGNVMIFTIQTLLVMTVSLICRSYPHPPAVVRRQEGFIVVVITWLSLSFFSALPFYLSGMAHSWVDAFFEGVSGITTTGAEIFHVSGWHQSLLFYHQWLQGVGGIGVIILVLAVLPYFGVSGHYLYQAELKDDKITPRLSQTTRIIIVWYILIAVLCSLAYWGVGLSFFEAICAALSTTSTGGFYIYNEGFSIHNDVGVSCVAMIFMVVGAIGFKTHLGVWLYRRWGKYWHDYETRLYLKIVMILLVGSCFVSWFMPYTSALQWLFASLSMITTTGLFIHGQLLWPVWSVVIWFILCLMGGCSGSTSGGVRLYRCVFLQQEIKKTLSILSHPQRISEYYLGEKPFPYHLRQTIRGFWCLFLITILIGLMITSIYHMPVSDAFPLIWACLTNTGAVLSGIGQELGYSVLDPAIKWLLSMLMIMGRVEIMMFYLFLLPSFWRN